MFPADSENQWDLRPTHALLKARDWLIAAIKASAPGRSVADGLPFGGIEFEPAGEDFSDATEHGPIGGTETQSGSMASTTRKPRSESVWNGVAGKKSREAERQDELG